MGKVLEIALKIGACGRAGWEKVSPLPAGGTVETSVKALAGNRPLGLPPI